MVSSPAAVPLHRLGRRLAAARYHLALPLPPPHTRCKAFGPKTCVTFPGGNGFEGERGGGEGGGRGAEEG
jgi:hypothetical protein